MQPVGQQRWAEKKLLGTFYHLLLSLIVGGRLGGCGAAGSAGRVSKWRGGILHSLALSVLRGHFNTEPMI